MEQKRTRAVFRSALGAVLLLVTAASAQGGGARLPASGQPPRPAMAAGELIVRLRSEFPACAHCLLAKGAGFKSVTGTYILDQVRLRHGITAMEPLFGGIHAAARRSAAQQRFGVRGPSGGAGAGPLDSQLSTPNLSQTYLVRVDPKTDLLALAAEFRRDPNVVSAEPNYLYSVKSTVDSRQSRVVFGSFNQGSPRPPSTGSRQVLGEGQGEGSESSDPPLPDDPFLSSSGSWGQDFPDLWGLFQIHAPEAWELSEGEGVIVAVIDTGIDIEHPDLAANVWHNTGEVPGNGADDDGNGFSDDVNGWDFTTCKTAYADGQCIEAKEPGPDVTDRNGHGTHVAGTIAAVGDNAIGIIGVAPKAQVMAVKGLNDQGQGTNADLAAALVYAAENGANVINASWSGPPSDTIKTAIEYVTQMFDVVVVVAAGNGGVPLEQGFYPANLPEVVAVGATTHTDEVASFSNFGGPLDLVAPGGGDAEPATATDPDKSVLSLLAKDSDLGRVCHLDCHCASPACCADPECDDEVCEQVCDPAPWVVSEEYVRLAGTSFAAPHVSGVAALVRSRHPEFTEEQVRQILLQSADDLGPAGWDPNFGYGRVNAQRAVATDDMPVAEILVPENRGKIWERDFPFTVTGTVAAPGGAVQGWRLMLRREDGNAATEISSGTASVSDGPLGTLALESAQGLELGQRYVLQLEVEDGNGNTATDTKVFLIPNPQYAAIPLPDPFDEGGFTPALSGDGRWAAVTRSDRDPPYATSIWLFDLQAHKSSRIKEAGFPWLSANGQFFLYFASGLRLNDLMSGLTLPIELPELLLRGSDGYSFRVDSQGTHVAFVSAGDLDATGESGNRSVDLFVLDRATGIIRQLTKNSQGSPAFQITDLVMTPNAERFAFSTNADLDPTATTGGVFQVFLYDDTTGAARQLSGRTPEGPNGGGQPSISADGGTVAYESDGLYVADVASGRSYQAASSLGDPADPELSADGRQLAFVAQLDLDPSVGNEDLSPEVFLLDLATQQPTQITDTAHETFYPSGMRMDASGSTFLLTASPEINGIGLDPSTVRVVRRRHPNVPPTLQAPQVITAQEGLASCTHFHALDPDGDVITLYAQRVPAFAYGRLRDLAHSVFTDHGDGTADLSFKPDYTDAGTYPLRIAAFDEAGGVDVKDVTLVIEDTEPEGDANCDGSLGLDDVQAMISALFNSNARAQCITRDTNVDGQVTVGDLVALLRKL